MATTATAKELWIVYFLNGKKHVVGQQMIEKGQEKANPFSTDANAHNTGRAWKDNWDSSFYLVTASPERVPEEKPANWKFGYRPPTPKK